MSYTRTIMRRPTRVARGMGRRYRAFADDAGDNADNANDMLTQDADSVCGTSPDMVTLEAQIQDLSINWNPTGLYKASDVAKIATAAGTVVINATNQLFAQAIPNVQPNSDWFNSLQSALDAANSTFQGMYPFIDAVNKAGGNTSSNLVNAPGLKQWVLDMMTVAANGFQTAYLSACAEPWWTSAAASINSAFTSLNSVCKSVVSAVAKVGQTAVNVVSGGLDLLAFVSQYAVPIAVIGGIGVLWYLYGDKLKGSAYAP